MDVITSRLSASDSASTPRAMRSYSFRHVASNVLMTLFIIDLHSVPFAMAFSSNLLRVGYCQPLSSSIQHDMILENVTHRPKHMLKMCSDDNDAYINHMYQHENQLLPCSYHSGKKRFLLRKYSRALALSTTLLFNPLASVPFNCRCFGKFVAPAQAATTTTSKLAPSSESIYNFKDFKNVKKKLSLAPGANAQAFEELLQRVAIDGDSTLGNSKNNDIETALSIGLGDKSNEGSLTESRGIGRKAKMKIQKHQRVEKEQVSEWESDEFGFGEDNDDDDDANLLKLRSTLSSSKGSVSKVKSSLLSSGSGEDGDVVVTEKMAYDKYQGSDPKEVHAKRIKKNAILSIFPIFAITMIRGQIRAYREKKWVKKGLAIVEEERKAYLEEKKNKKQGKNGDDEDDIDDDEEEEDKSSNKNRKKK